MATTSFHATSLNTFGINLLLNASKSTITSPAAWISGLKLKLQPKLLLTFYDKGCFLS